MLFLIHPAREDGSLDALKKKKQLNISCVEKVESWRRVCVCEPSPECEGKVP